MGQQMDIFSSFFFFPLPTFLFLLGIENAMGGMGLSLWCDIVLNWTGGGGGCVCVCPGHNLLGIYPILKVY